MRSTVRADVPEPISPWVRVLVVINQNNHTDPTRIARVNTITGDPDESQARTRHLIKVFTAAGHPTPNLSATQTAGLVPLPDDVINLIRDLTHGGSCSYDQRGTCLTHVWTDPDRACPHATAKALIANHTAAKEN
jgi:hypothetical protein